MLLTLLERLRPPFVYFSVVKRNLTAAPSFCAGCCLLCTGELIVLASGVKRWRQDIAIDALLLAHGYRSTLEIMDMPKTSLELRDCLRYVVCMLPMNC